MKRLAVAVTVVLFATTVLPSTVRATPVPVPLDSTQSSVTLTLTATVPPAPTATSSDTSRVGGTITIKVAPTTTTPASLTLYNSHMELLDTIDLTLTFRVFNIPVGTFVAHSRPVPNNIKLDYAPTPPGTPQPPTPVAANGAFNAPNVPSISTGIIDYTSTGIVCTAFGQQVPPVPCSGTMDLSANGVQNGTFAGTVTLSAARLLTLVSTVNQSVPLDPANPSTGTLTTAGTVRGTISLPRRGDADLDGVVDSGDIPAFVGVMLNPTGFGWDKRFAVDMNDDDQFDAADVTSFVNCLLGNGCPN